MHGVEAGATVDGQGRLLEVEASATAGPGRRPVGADKTFRSYDPDQVLLMAPVLQEWIPEGDLAHFVSDLVETGALDLSAIYAAYEEERGYPPYDPRLMVKLLVYGYATGVMSSRKLERATYRDVAVRMLCADQHPGLPVDRALPQASSRRVGGAVRAGVAAVPQGAVGGAGDAGGRRHQAARECVAPQGDEL